MAVQSLEYRLLMVLICNSKHCNLQRITSGGAVVMRHKQNLRDLHLFLGKHYQRNYIKNWIGTMLWIKGSCLLGKKLQCTKSIHSSLLAEHSYGRCYQQLILRTCNNTLVPSCSGWRCRSSGEVATEVGPRSG